MTALNTFRLKLVPFADDHLDGLNNLNSDPEVMRYISGRPETREETVAFIERVKQRWTEFGYSWWSFIDKESGGRLRRDYWNRGLATEAAHAIAGFAFNTIQADEIYAVCHPDNLASAKVMKRLGMQYAGLQTWYGKNVVTYQVTSKLYLK